MTVILNLHQLIYRQFQNKSKHDWVNTYILQPAQILSTSVCVATFESNTPTVSSNSCHSSDVWKILLNDMTEIWVKENRRSNSMPALELTRGVVKSLLDFIINYNLAISLFNYIINGEEIL